MGIGEWLGVIAIALGIIVLPTALQMFCGRPKIEFEFSVVGDKKNSALQCKILNRPIESKFLTWLGVRRENAHIFAAYRVENTDTGEIVVDLMQPIIVSKGRRGKEFELTSSFLGVSIAIAWISEQGVYALEEEIDKKAIPLKSGIYSVPLMVFCGEKSFPVRRNFVVTSNPIDTYWASISS